MCLLTPLNPVLLLRGMLITDQLSMIQESARSDYAHVHCTQCPSYILSWAEHHSLACWFLLAPSNRQFNARSLIVGFSAIAHPSTSYSGRMWCLSASAGMDGSSSPCSAGNRRVSIRPPSHMSPPRLWMKMEST